MMNFNEPSPILTLSTPSLFAACIAGVILAFLPPQASATPATPTNPSASPSKHSTDLTGFLINWTTGTGDQTGVEVYASLDATGASGYTLVYDAMQTATSALVNLNASAVPPGIRVWFIVRTYSGTQAAKTALSANSVSFFTDVPVVTTYNPPTNLAVSLNGSVPHLTWTDNSVLEDVFEVEGRDTSVVGSAFQLVVQLGFNFTQGDIANYFQAGKTYELRMRARRWTAAYKTSTAAYTGYSGTVSVTIPGSVVAGPGAPIIAGPTMSWLSADYKGFKVDWTDTSNNETGFEIWMPENGYGTGRSLVGEAGANAAYAHLYFNAAGTPVGSSLYFDVRAYTGTTTRTYSAWSSVASIVVSNAQAFDAPMSLVGSLVSGVPHLTWVDNSDLEDVFQVEGRDTTEVGSTFQYLTAVDFNLTQLDLPNYLQAGKTYELRMRARRWAGNYGTTAGYTGYTNTVTIMMPGTVAAPPASPVNLAVAAYTSNGSYVYGLSWDDKSVDETGFEIQEKGNAESTWRTLQVVSGDTPGTPTGIGVGYVGHYNSSGTIVFFAANDFFDFQVSAVRGVGPFRVVSTNYATVLGTKQASFDPPSNLRLTAPADNGLIQLFWSDNATTEEGVEIEYSIAGGAYQVLGPLAQTDYARYQNGGGIGTYPPSTQIQFRLRAYNGGSSKIYTAYSNVASVTMPDMTAPTNLQQGSVGVDTVVNLTWADNSQNDAGYGVEVRKTLPLPADVSFSSPVKFTTVSATATPVSASDGIVPGYTYEFRVRAANQVTNTSPIIYSTPSNVVTATVPPIAAPGNLRVQNGTLTETSVTLNWDDNSAVEGGYNIYSRPAGSSSAPTLQKKVAAGVVTATMGGLTPAASVEFFVEAFITLNPSGEVVSAMSPGLIVTARDAMTSAVYIEIHKDEAMTPYTLTTTTSSATVTRSITGLPAGLSFDSGTGVLSGTPTGTGVIKCPVAVTFADGWTHNNTLAIRILQAPVANAFPAQNLAPGTPVSIPLSDKFTDPDASSAVRVNTNLAANGGNMDFILFNAATPLHVANFMGYVNRGDYVNTVFHRSIAGFVSQGGGFRPGAGPTLFTAVPTQPPVTNEPGISNIRGTVALAKTDAGPSTGTNQFFVNLANNGPNLDIQNGGFTAFARVTAPGMAVADALAALPTGNYNVTVGSTATTMTDYPFNAASVPATMDNTQSVKINTVTALPVLTFSVVSNSNAGVVTPSIVSGSLSLTPVSVGDSNVVIRATDLEGHAVDQTVAVTVGSTFAAWAGSQGLPVGKDGPTDDADGDGDTNLEEFAFLTSPTVAGEHASLSPALQAVGPDQMGSITFKVRKFATLTYTVEASADLSGAGWTTIWTTAQGFGAANVVSAVDNLDHTLVTIKDTAALSSSVQRFLRVKVTLPGS